MSKQTTILQIVPEIGVGGAEQAVIDVAYALVKRNVRAIVVANGGHRLPEFLRTGAEHIQMDVDTKNPFKVWQNSLRLRDIIKKHKVDIVHARSRAPAWSAWQAVKNTRTAFMTTCHAPYKISNEMKRKYNAIMTKGERVIAISEFVANYLRENYEFLQQNIRVVPRGIALEKYHPAAVTPERLAKLQREWRVPDGQRIILCPGRLTKWKGQAVMLEAFSKLKEKDIWLVMVGSDQGRSEYRQALESQINMFELQERVRIIDHCDDMPAAYVLATAVCVPSIEPEGFGRVAVEAQAMGRICIATGHGAAVETVIDNKTGFLVPPNDGEALAKKIEHVLALSPEKLDAIVYEGMNNAVQKFGREQMLEKTINVYNELLPAEKHIPIEEQARKTKAA
ncbi:MAG: glycosyltransferase [Alphaproteobacteria bacterium]|nr:glycosyltransferase [Alphaproteobacteria bacterium]